MDDGNLVVVILDEFDRIRNRDVRREIADLIKSMDHLFRHVLLACALAETNELGYFPASAVSSPMNVVMGKQYDVPSFARHLKEFCQKGRGQILERIGGRYNVQF